MAGGTKSLSGAMKQALERVERDLAILKGGSYFTEEQWVQIDYIIHQGKYKFTNGPSKTLIDFFEPLDDQFVNMTIEGGDLAEDGDLLKPIESKDPSSLPKTDKFDDSDDTAVGENASPSYQGSEDARSITSHKTATTTKTPKMAKQTAWVAETAKKKKAAAEAEAARKLDLQDVEDHEMNAAREWEVSDDDEPAVTPPSTNLAAETIAAIQSEIDAQLEAKLQKLVEVDRAPSRTSKLDSRVCSFWAKGHCKFSDDSCRKLHHYPKSTHSTSSKYQNSKQRAQVNKHLWAHTDRKSGLISTKKELTCYAWAKAKGGCPTPAELCTHSHWQTGKLAEAPFWERNHDDGCGSEKEEVAIDSAASVSDGGIGKEWKISQRVDDHTGMNVELGEGHNETEKGNIAEAKDFNAPAEMGILDWAEEVNMAAESASEKTMILGAAAGGWGNDSMEQIGAAADDGWKTVASKKGGKDKLNDEITW